MCPFDSKLKYLKSTYLHLTSRGWRPQDYNCEQGVGFSVNTLGYFIHAGVSFYGLKEEGTTELSCIQ